MNCSEEAPSFAADFLASVFISYSRSDLDRVRAVAAELRKCRVRTWIDVEDLKPGQHWKEAIETALDRTSAMVFFLSPLSVESSWTSVELKTAIIRKIPIIPVMVEHVEMANIHPELRARHIYDMTRHLAGEAAAVTARAIASSLGVTTQHETSRASPSGGANLLVVALGKEPDLTSLWKKANWLQVRRSDVDVRYVPTLTPVVFAELSEEFNRAYHIVLSVSDDSNQNFIHLLLGLAAARLGPKRVTIIDFCDGSTWFETVAEVIKAHYLKMLKQ